MCKPGMMGASTGVDVPADLSDNAITGHHQIPISALLKPIAKRLVSYRVGHLHRDHCLATVATLVCLVVVTYACFLTFLNRPLTATIYHADNWPVLQQMAAGATAAAADARPSHPTYTLNLTAATGGPSQQVQGKQTQQSTTMFQSVEQLVSSAKTQEKQQLSRQQHERLFLPVVLRNGMTGLEGPCSPEQHRTDRSNKIVHVALGVLSGAAPKYSTRRAAWRSVYNRWPEDVRSKIVMRFFIALPKDEPTLGLLEREAAEHRDLIVLGHTDDYLNISMKSIGLFTWGAEACGAYYIVKTDDDTFINLPKFINLLYKSPPLNFYGGTFDPKWSPERKKHKYSTPQDEYPFAHGPAFARGALVVLSWDLAATVARVRNIPNFHWLPWEDVTVGHLVATSSPQMVELGVFAMKSEPRCRNTDLAVHYVDQEKLEVLQNNVLAKRELCINYP